jgi:hypothetical protein
LEVRILSRRNTGGEQTEMFASLPPNDYLLGRANLGDGKIHRTI